MGAPRVFATMRAFFRIDKPASCWYPPFNMNRQRYCTFAKNTVRFCVLDTNRLDRPQLAWFEQALRSSRED